MTMAQTNVYSGLDTRVGSTTNNVANTYLRNGAYVTDAVLKDSTATFTPGVSERRGSTTTFSHSGLKNADAQTGVSQTVAATKQYDAFGNLASSTGTWQGQFGYGGGFGYQQDATGLKLLGHRYYDSSTGRFLTRDPIKDGRNWYVYCGSDPIGFSDATGGSAVPVGAAVPLTVVEGGLGAGGGAAAGAGGLSGGAAAGLYGAAAIAGWGIGRALDEKFHISDKILDHIYPTSLPVTESEKRRRIRKPQLLYRVVEQGEIDAIKNNGGFAVPSPTYEWEKPFWVSREGAENYKANGPGKTSTYKEIWVWINVARVGGSGPIMDSHKTWMVPNGQLPLLGPGSRVP